MDDIISKLKDKDEKVAYEYAKMIGAESAESDKYLKYVYDFSNMLEDSNSYVRVRAFFLICNQARWANDGQIMEVFERMSSLLYDSKPTVVRQCLGALHEVILYRPEMADVISEAVGRIDVNKYKDSMSPLIRRDIEALVALIR